jgi:hypothetical protein
VFFIGTAFFLLAVVLIGVPVIRLISRPLNAYHPLAARFVRISLWVVVVLSIATWPVVGGPIFFELKCSYFTKFQVEPAVDARVTGYLDERLSNFAYVETHMDNLFFRKDVDDLLAGRIAFFEMEKVRNALTDETSMPYLRYSIVEVGSPKCLPRITGSTHGIGGLAVTVAGKCLGVEAVLSPISQYQVRTSGDINMVDGTTKIVERSTDRVIAVYRSFYYSFLESGSFCPGGSVEGQLHDVHVELTKLVFLDAKGSVRKASFR